MKKNNQIAIFQGKNIRKTIYNKEWWFSVVDVIEALTDSPTPRQYWGKVKQREFIDLQLSPIWVQLKLMANDGKYYQTDCADTEGLFRIIQSIPSPKAEPFKRWLAKVGYERIKEIEDPEKSIWLTFFPVIARSYCERGSLATLGTSFAISG